MKNERSQACRVLLPSESVLFLVLACDEFDSFGISFHVGVASHAVVKRRNTSSCADFLHPSDSTDKGFSFFQHED